MFNHDLPLFPPPSERLNPFSFYARMRRDHPVARNDRAGVWGVYRYCYVRQVLADAQTFSSDLRQVSRPRPALHNLRPNLLHSDGAPHRQLRTPVAAVFSPSARAQWEAMTCAHVNHLLDRVIPESQMDVIGDLACPLSLAVMMELMGVPEEDSERFASWWKKWLHWRDLVPSHRRSNLRTPPEPWYSEMHDYLRRLATQRWLNTREDLVSTVVAMKVAGERLQEDEVVEFCLLLLLAAHLTTTHLISNAVLCLLENQEALMLLRNEPTRLPKAIEEVLRYASPVQAVSRVAVRDVELGGQVIGAGQETLAFIGAANRDEEQFHEPDLFDIERRPNPHIAFGLGEHFCFGAPLARLQARVALTALLRRLRRPERVDGAPLEPVRNPFLLGTVRLLIRFIPERSSL